MYSTVKQLRPHFHSLREIKSNISLDMKLPKNWIHEEIIREYKLAFKVQDEGTELKLISIVGNATEDGYEAVFSCALKIIRVNMELEEKTKLYKEKIKELEEIFKMSPLEKLKRIKFDTDEQDEIQLNLAEDTNGEGSDGVGEPQDENDPGIEDIE